MKKYILVVLSLLLILTSCTTLNHKDSYKAAIAWRNDDKSIKYQRLVKYFEDEGFEVTLLSKVTTDDIAYVDGEISDDYLNFDFSLSDEATSILKTTDSINIEEDLDDYDIIVFSGGEDISPTLYRDDYEPSFDYMYNAERDSSDYLLMRYVIDHDIPALGICRGMQMLAVASGLNLIEDIPTIAPELEGVHRAANGDYSFHSVTTKTGIIREVASAHHQELDYEEGHNIIATENTESVVEAIERTDKKLIVGVQYHPEYYADHEDMLGAKSAYALLENIKKEL